MKWNRLIWKLSCGALLFGSMACSEANSSGEESQQQSEPEPFIQQGEASFYSKALKGSKMANGKPYKPLALTAAHKRLPLGTKIEVMNTENDSSVVVEITDRGPYAKNRIIDLSRAAAQKLDFISDGHTEVVLQVVEPAEGYSVNDSTVAGR